jgi:hypothetical protein
MTAEPPPGRGIAGTPLWIVPFAIGALLCLFGVAIWAVPSLLEFIVAGAFFALGLAVMAISWRLRSRGGGGGGGVRVRTAEFKVED